MRPAQLLLALHVAGAVVVVALVLLDASETIIGIVVPMPLALWQPLRELLPRKAVAAPERRAEIGADFSMHPAVVMILMVAYLQVVQRVVGGAAGAAISFVVPVDTTLFDIAFATALLSLAASAILVVPIAIWASHRIARNPLVWVLGALAVSPLINIAVITIVFGPVFDATTMAFEIALEFLFLLPGALVGVWWARRTRVDFVMSMLFRRLVSEDRHDLIALARTAGLRAVTQETVDSAGAPQPAA